MSEPARLTRDLTEPEPIPEAGIARANALMRSGRLFRYGEMGADQLDVSQLEVEFAAFVGRRYCVAVNSGGGPFSSRSRWRACNRAIRCSSTASRLPRCRARSCTPQQGP